MIRFKPAAMAALLLTGLIPGAASAQFYLKSPDYSGPPVTGAEPDIAQALPGAKPDEMRAAVIWNMRAGLNVAALQCQFEPTLLTQSQYNDIMRNHGAELTGSYAKLGAYFKRTAPNPKAAQTALDQYNRRTYDSMSTVYGQYGFCQTAADVGRAALFTRKGQVGDIAAARLRELKNSLLPAWDRQFPRFSVPYHQATVNNLDPRCWDKKDNYRARCGGLA